MEGIKKKIASYKSQLEDKEALIDKLESDKKEIEKEKHEVCLFCNSSLNLIDLLFIFVYLCFVLRDKVLLPETFSNFSCFYNSLLQIQNHQQNS